MVQFFGTAIERPVWCEEGDRTMNRYIRSAQRTWGYPKEMTRDSPHSQTSRLSHGYALLLSDCLPERSWRIGQYSIIILEEMHGALSLNRLLAKA